MNNFTARFSNKRELTFPATTLNNAKVLAANYAKGQGIYVNKVCFR